MSEQFDAKDIEMAVSDLATLPYFPSESRASVMEFLVDVCPHKTALRWLVKTATARCKRWPGLSELRGLLCTRYDAVDGIDEPDCSIPGYTIDDREAQYLKLHKGEKAAQITAGESRAILKRLTSATQGRRL